jgi:chorismate dehydratase
MSHHSADARIRIGAVSYLNTKPLVFQLEELAPEAEVIYDVPSRLAEALAAGRLDVALVPSIEYLQHPGYTVVSDACIACRGPVLSVKLLSKVPRSRIRTLALDEGSRTSVVLVRILLRQLYGCQPDLLPLRLDDAVADSPADAVLLIGDRAIRPTGGVFVEQWDLGEAWCRWSGLPFVFAMWTARSEACLDRIEPTLRRARDLGVAHLGALAEKHAAAAGLTYDECLAYLRDHLYFYLGPAERQGLERFRGLAEELDLSPALQVATSVDDRVDG